MPTFVSGLTSNAPGANGTAINAARAAAPVANGTAVNNANGKGATVPVSGFANGMSMGGSTAPYIGVAALPPLPTTGQLWPPLN